MVSPANYDIAVKELIIEWDDKFILTEVCGYVQCDGVQDLINQTLDMEGSLKKTRSDEYQTQNKKQLWRFVKKAGLKTSFIQIPKEKMTFYTLDLRDVKQTFEEELREEGFNRYIRRQHEIILHLKSLLDDNEILPIKKAHITVEIHATYPEPQSNWTWTNKFLIDNLIIVI